MKAERSKSAAKSAHSVGRSTPAASGWIVLRVVLQRQGGQEFSQPPGRDLLIHGSHSFAEVAAAIDRAFARWDLSHLHEFRISDGRRIGTVDDEFGEGDNELDERRETVAKAALSVGDRFEYVFDFGDGWEHVCTVLRDQVDPKKGSGIGRRERA